MKKIVVFSINCKVYMLKAWHKSKMFLHVQSIQTLRVDSPYDALPTPWKIQMWIQVENNGRRRSRGTLPNSQQFDG